MKTYQIIVEEQDTFRTVYHVLAENLDDAMATTETDGDVIKRRLLRSEIIEIKSIKEVICARKK